MFIMTDANPADNPEGLEKVKKSVSRLPSAETRWRACEEAQTKRSLVLRGLTRRS
jgi:hypothetical protein